MSTETIILDEAVGIVDQRLRGFFIVDNDVFSAKRELSAYALLVYCVLCRLAVAGGATTLATRGYIAKLARVSAGSVTNAVAELETAGLVNVERRREGSKKLPSKYTLNQIERRSGGDGQVVTVTTPPISTNALLSTNAHKGKTNTPLKQIFTPPEWINPEAWEGYIDVRKAKKAVLTERALASVIRKLDEFRARGHDPNEILETSMRSNWTDVYEPKGSRNGNGDKATERGLITRDNIAAAVERIEAKRNADGTSAGLLPQPNAARRYPRSLPANVGGNGHAVRDG